MLDCLEDYFLCNLKDTGCRFWRISLEVILNHFKYAIDTSDRSHFEQDRQRQQKWQENLE